MCILLSFAPQSSNKQLRIRNEGMNLSMSHELDNPSNLIKMMQMYLIDYCCYESMFLLLRLRQVLLHQDLGKRPSSFVRGIFIFLTNQVLVSKLQSFGDYANDVILCGMQFAQSIKFLNRLQVAIVIHNLVHTSNDLIIVDVQIKFQWNCQIRCIVNPNANVLLDHSASVLRLVAKDRNTNKWSFAGNGFSNGAPAAVSHVSSNLRKSQNGLLREPLSMIDQWIVQSYLFWCPQAPNSWIAQLSKNVGQFFSKIRVESKYTSKGNIQKPIFSLSLPSFNPPLQFIRQLLRRSIRQKPNKLIIARLDAGIFKPNKGMEHDSSPIAIGVNDSIEWSQHRDRWQLLMNKKAFNDVASFNTYEGEHMPDPKGIRKVNYQLYLILLGKVGSFNRKEITDNQLRQLLFILKIFFK